MGKVLQSIFLISDRSCNPNQQKGVEVEDDLDVTIFMVQEEYCYRLLSHQVEPEAHVDLDV